MSWRYLPPVRSPVGFRAVGAGLFPPPEALAAARALISRDYGTDELVLTDSGTSALRLALEAIPAREPGVPPLVALPAYGCYDLATAADGAGVRVVLYDVDPNTLSPDLSSLEHALSAGVTAVVVAHLYGLSVDLGAISRMVADAGAVLIEDAAQAVGASYDGRPLGAIGAFGVLSFGRGKGRTAGAGGALLVNDPHARELLAARAGPALSVRDPVGSVAKLAVQWLLGRPAAYRIPASLPFLGLGETPYHAPHPPAALGRRAAAILATTWDASGAEASVRRENAARWQAVLAGRPQVTAVEPAAGSVPGFLRYPVRLPSGVLDDRARSLGMMPGYPTALADLRGFAERCLPTGRPFPGARELAMRLVTWPTHGWVTEGDRQAVDDWVSRWWARPRSTKRPGVDGVYPPIRSAATFRPIDASLVTIGSMSEPTGGPGLSFHHIGVASRDLDAEERVYRALGYRREGEEFVDPIQCIRGRFLIGGGPRLELLVQIPGKSVLEPWLRKGIRLYHLAWEADDLPAASAHFVAERARVVVPPVPAVAFGGRLITFLMLPNLQLIELIASAAPQLLEGST